MRIRTEANECIDGQRYHYQKATSPTHAQLIRNIHLKFNKEIAAQHDGDNDDDTTDNSERPDGDNDNDNDVDCFPRQDKQPVLPQPDISPTAPTANNTPPSLIESSTDNPDDDDDDDDSMIIHDNRCYYNSDYDDDAADGTYTLDNSFDSATGIDDSATGNDG